MKAGIFRLLAILVFLTAVFSTLNLISLKKPLAPPAEKPLCPFVLAISPPFTGTTPQVSRPTPPDEFNASPAPAKRPEVSGKFREIPETAGGRFLYDTGFFSAVLSHTAAESRTGLKPVFYLPLHLTRDNRWLVSESPFFVRQPALTEEPPQAVAAKKQSSTNPPAERPLFRQSAVSPRRPRAPEKISRFTLGEIQKQLSSKKPLTLKDLLRRFPKQKWFPHFFTENREEAFKSLKDLFEKSPILYITSNNEKLLQRLSKKPTAVIYGFRTLVRFQLLGTFLPKKLFSFPGQGLVIPSTLPLSSERMKKLKSAGQQLFLHWETGVTALPRQKLKQAKGLITREWKPALQLLKNKNPCL